MRALYNYTAQREGELSFDEEDLLYVCDQTVDTKWWKARCNNKEGLIPATYVAAQTEEVQLPLHEAARRGNLSLLKEYLKEGVSGTGLDSAGNTPLYWAARAGHFDCVKELLALPNSAINASNKMGDTSLHIAAIHGHWDIVMLLIEKGADINMKNGNGVTVEDLITDPAVKNMIQMNQRKNHVTHKYEDEDYKDDSD